jgi:hypothetical protein
MLEVMNIRIRLICWLKCLCCKYAAKAPSEQTAKAGGWGGHGWASSRQRLVPGSAEACVQACGFSDLGNVLIDSGAESGSPQSCGGTIFVRAWWRFIKVLARFPALNIRVRMLRQHFVSRPRDDARRVPFAGLCLLCHRCWQMKRSFE